MTPTKPGFYWMRDSSLVGDRWRNENRTWWGQWHIAEFIPRGHDRTGIIRVFGYYQDTYTNEHPDAEWRGPLEPPRE